MIEIILSSIYLGMAAATLFFAWQARIWKKAAHSESRALERVVGQKRKANLIAQQYEQAGMKMVQRATDQEEKVKKLQSECKELREALRKMQIQCEIDTDIRNIFAYKGDTRGQQYNESGE